MFNQDYFLGLDIGTDSVGYAVTNEEYALAKFKGEPMWGATVFEPANQCADRRAFRTARRRLDRKQQRVALIGELFAAEIAKIDPRFFIRRKESALYRGDTSDAGDTSLVFNDGNYKDRDMYKDYPTIHHLIVDLMSSDEPHDVRLVYLACAWLVAHRGHFLSEVDRDNIDNVRDFTAVYESFLEHFKENEYHMPWNCNPDEFAKVMQQKKGVSKKEKEFFNLLFDGKKPKSDQNELCPYSRASMIKLLCGGSVAPKDLFKSDGM